MDWLRLVGSLKLQVTFKKRDLQRDIACERISQVSFAKEPYKRDNILQKRRIISRNLLICNSHPAKRETLRSRDTVTSYGVATISGLLKIIGVFCERALKKRRYSAKETYNPKEPTHRSNPIPYLSHTCLLLRGVQIADQQILKIIGLFCRIWSLVQGSFAKGTYDFQEPTNRSHLIAGYRISRTQFLSHRGVRISAILQD